MQRPLAGARSSDGATGMHTAQLGLITFWWRNNWCACWRINRKILTLDKFNGWLHLWHFYTEGLSFTQMTAQRLTDRRTRCLTAKQRTRKLTAFQMQSCRVDYTTTIYTISPKGIVRQWAVRTPVERPRAALRLPCARLGHGADSFGRSWWSVCLRWITSWASSWDHARNSNLKK